MRKLIVVVGLVLAVYTAGQGHGGLGLSVFVVAAFLAMFSGSSGKAMTGHAHAGPVPKIARHEAGHAAVARHVGGKVRSATVESDGSGGYTAVTLPDHDPVKAVAFWYGGQYAVSSREGAGEDERKIRRELRGVPSKDRARVHREAKALARAALSARSGDVRRDTAKLIGRGRL